MRDHVTGLFGIGIRDYGKGRKEWKGGEIVVGGYNDGSVAGYREEEVWEVERSYR